MRRLSSAAPAALFRPSRLHPASRPARWAMLALLSFAPLAGAGGVDTSFDFGINGGIHVVPQGTAYVEAIAHLPRPGGGSVVVYAHDSNACPTGQVCLMLEPFNDAGQPLSRGWVSSATMFSSIAAAAIDSQGRVVVVGDIKHDGADHDFRIVRLSPQGVLDPTFNGDGLSTVWFDVGGDEWDAALAVAIDSQDRIVVAGFATTTDVGDHEFAIARLEEDGSLDPSFSGTGKRRIPFELTPGHSAAIGTALAIDSQGRIVAGGSAVDPSLGSSFIAMARLMPDGSYDTTWCPPGECLGVDPAISSGRNVIWFGSWNDHADQTVAALAVNAIDQVAIVGDHSLMGVVGGYAMTFTADGKWRAEKSIIGGFADYPGSSSMGGVAFLSPTRPGSDLAVTGTRGNSGADDWSYFFAQCLRNTGDLAPCANWGNDSEDGENQSTTWFYTHAISQSPDPYGNVPHASAVDAKGRVLMAGRTLKNGVLAGVAARLLNDEVFRDGFE